jgi:hypothetical protein
MRMMEGVLAAKALAVGRTIAGAEAAPTLSRTVRPSGVLFT